MLIALFGKYTPVIMDAYVEELGALHRKAYVCDVLYPPLGNGRDVSNIIDNHERRGKKTVEEYDLCFFRDHDAYTTKDNYCTHQSPTPTNRMRQFSRQLRDTEYWALILMYYYVRISSAVLITVVIKQSLRCTLSTKVALALPLAAPAVRNLRTNFFSWAAKQEQISRLTKHTVSPMEYHSTLRSAGILCDFDW